MDEFVEDKPLLDRSTLEGWSICPLQARGKELGLARHVGAAAIVGQQVHDIFSACVSEYVDRRGIMDVSEVVSFLEEGAASARPDVQPDVLRALAGSRWNWAKWLVGQDASRILRWDGGLDDQSGQLAAPLEGVLVTGEVDLLLTTRFPGIVHLCDWKTGWKDWTIDDVADSFQFAVYAWLVFCNYETVNMIQVRIWKTRFGQWTGCDITRADILNLTSRLHSAVQVYRQYHDTVLERVPGWPERDKCAICDVALHCGLADRPSRDINTDPGQFVELMAARESQLDAMREIAASWVDAHGCDIVADSGAKFGRNKPKQLRKPSAELY